VSPLLLTACLLLQAAGSSQPPPEPPEQQDVVDVARRLLNRPPPPDDGDDERRVIVPTIGSAPSAGTSFGVLMTRQKSTESGGRSLRMIGGSYSTANRLQITARFEQPIASHWQLFGDWRFYDFTERTYGLGSDTSSDTFADVKLAWGRVHTTAYRTIRPGLAVGGGYQLDVRRYDDVEGELPNGTDRTTIASGLSVDALFDNRDKPTNASRGYLGRAGYTWFPEALGSDHSWQTMEFDGRTYVKLPSRRRQIIAGWVLGWLTTSGDPTYFDHPWSGGDMYGRTSRGYAAGRFRGRDWIDIEAEYRVDLMANGLVGAVAFVNSSTLSDANGHFGRWAPGGGAGVRIKFDKDHGSNLCVDYAWGVEGSRGLFLSLNEAF
jgi:hypothetical protein